VDSFFPFLKEIQKEVIAIEDLVLANKILVSLPSSTITETVPPPPFQPGTEEKQVSISMGEKIPTAPVPMTRTRFSLPPVTFPLVLRRIKQTIARRWKKLFTSSEHDRSAPKPQNLLKTHSHGVSRGQESWSHHWPDCSAPSQKSSRRSRKGS
jgi:magnesium transporter